jgi:hypothetical protein
VLGRAIIHFITVGLGHQLKAPEGNQSRKEAKNTKLSEIQYGIYGEYGREQQPREEGRSERNKEKK